MSVLKEGFGCSDEDLFEKCEFDLLTRKALPNGLLCLKGGNLKEELKQYFKISEITPLSTFFDEEWFNHDKLYKQCLFYSIHVCSC